MSTRSLVLLLLSSFPIGAAAQLPVETQPLSWDDDIAARMVAGIDRFLLKKLDDAPASRAERWAVDGLDAEARAKFLKSKREELAKIIGVVDERHPFETFGTSGVIYGQPTVSKEEEYDVINISWPVLSDPAATARNLASIHGEGLLLQPRGQVKGTLIAIPDASQTPEQLAGLVEGVPEESQFARRAAECGLRVIIPTTISRHREKRNGRANLTDREYLYRSAFELGRHIIGYEVQKVLALVDWLKHVEPCNGIAVAGYGEGGLLTLFAGAVDERIDCICVSGAFGPFENVWKQPLDRNVFGLVKGFGAGELTAMFSGERAIVELTDFPEVKLDGDGGAPAEITTPTFDRGDYPSLNDRTQFTKVEAFCTAGIHDVLEQMAAQFGGEFSEEAWEASVINRRQPQSHLEPGRLSKQIASRHRRQFEEIDRHNQALLRESPFVRKEFLKGLKTSSVDAYETSVEEYRKIFRDDVIGSFDDELLPFNARSRQSWETANWTGHEVVLDVFEDVFAYGALLLPKDLKEGDKRPVVVCQHGLEGRPTDTFLNDHRAYHDFAAKLCERGFIVFAPQNPYIFKDAFRTLQRKANPLGKTLFSIIVPQHQQIVTWLKTQPNVDGDRIAFYGLSYGGKSAMRIPALVTDYCLSICSADFNEWVRKNASTRLNYSYVWTGEYEIFEWDLGSTFNYFEMAALICPRPFMVERGHFDGVGTDEWVAYEYAKVRHLYAARLKIPERTEIEWFDGPHTINGKGTFEFLHRHLNWPK